MSLITARTFTKVRPPAVAGTFYPGGKVELEAAVRKYLKRAKSEIGIAEGPAPKALIAPHAGYVYSGLTAAAAYNTLAPAVDSIRRVVLLGPCHRVPVQKLALPSTESFATPLGNIAVDGMMARQIAALPQVSVFDKAHQNDHALEVHLPFLQVMLDEFTIVPLIVGQATSEEVAEVLEALWGGAETLILVSSDLSHYLPYAAAQLSDNGARLAIERLDGSGVGDDAACGRHSIRPLLSLAKRKGLVANTIDVRNSGDTAGTKDRVVGYGSWRFDEKPSNRQQYSRNKADGKQTSEGTKGQFDGAARAMLDAHGESLLRLGARTILSHLGGDKQMHLDMTDYAPPLRENGACFVTLNKDGNLRGCIGSIQAHRPLLTDAAENSGRAAFRDSRFKPLVARELTEHHVTMHISVLSPQVPIIFSSEVDLVSQLRPGIDGVVLQDKGKRGVFLPVVWEQLPEPQIFFTHLKRKAGLPADHWSETVEAWRYVTEGVSSEELVDAGNFWSP
ncbi:MAG: AmmeMemoRadiSam system protein B [Pseudomonadota bacterium]|nr:AmmeMemoRadiSam system protein B [Pseudomonadota bacterium]